MSVEIQASDIIKIILQFCKENDLQDSFEVLQKESGVVLNVVADLDVFVDNIKHGRWDKVLQEVSNLKLPATKVQQLHEQIVLEMIELREVETARSLLHQSEALAILRVEDESRYMVLEKCCNRTIVDTNLLYGEHSRQKRRNSIAMLLQSEVMSVPPSRLMSLVGQAMKWQTQEGLIPPNVRFDIFSGTIPTKEDKEDIFPTQEDISIKFGSKSFPECAIFLPDGSGLVTGSSDGFIEIWDVWTGSLKLDLHYQASEKFLMHKCSILSLTVAVDGTLLASGSKDGQIKLWRLKSGQCLRTYDAAHGQGITSLKLSREKNKILSTSFDGIIRIHGIKSGKMLKEFRGHESFVYSAVFSQDESCILSASADCSICIWDTDTSDCILRIRPPHPSDSMEKPIVTAFYHPTDANKIVVCESGNNTLLMTLQGEIVRKFEIPNLVNESQVSCCLSNHGEFFLSITETGDLYCFQYSTGKLLQKIKTGSKKARGMVMHPTKNILACYFEEGFLKTFKPLVS